MILCIDIGNTNVVTAIWNGTSYNDQNRIESISGVKDRLSHVNFNQITQIVLSSVVPKLTEEYIFEIEKHSQIKPIIIGYQQSKIMLDVDFPHEVGADRICNSFAALKFFGSPTVVVDFGSATTYDVIDENNAFIGGAIAPGIDISAHHLIEKTALLRSAAFQFPQQVVGKNTKTNLQSGIMFSGVDAVEGMLSRIQQEMKWDSMNIILTGGFSKLISPQLSITHHLSFNLTLDGMRFLAE